MSGMDMDQMKGIFNESCAISTSIVSKLITPCGLIGEKKTLYNEGVYGVVLVVNRFTVLYFINTLVMFPPAMK